MNSSLPPLPVDIPPPRRWTDHDEATAALAYWRKYQARTFEPSAACFERLDDLADRLAEQSAPRAERRELELALAEYVAGPVYAYSGDADLLYLADGLRKCRRSGAVGIHDAGHLVAWDHKCGESKLCPDESHEETVRLINRYLPAVRAWLGTGPAGGWRRVFKAVLTLPNAPRGSLKATQADIFKRFKALCARKEPLPSELKVKGDRRRKRPVFPGIKGSLCCMENPLSARGDWNVHLNVILLVEGPFDWKRFRAEWGFDLDIQHVKGGDEGIAGALVESIKYMACVVSAKSHEHADRGKSKAPGMCDWPPDAWLEWWRAIKGARRTRSYGVLFKVPDIADTLDMASVQWVGVLDFEAGRYWVQLAGHAHRRALGVALTQGDNSRGSRRTGSGQKFLRWWQAAGGSGPPGFSGGANVH